MVSLQSGFTICYFGEFWKDIGFENLKGHRQLYNNVVYITFILLITQYKILRVSGSVLRTFGGHKKCITPISLFQSVTNLLNGFV